MGTASSADQEQAVAIGYLTGAGAGAVAVGSQAEALGEQSAAVGFNSSAAGEFASALGTNADAQAAGSTAIGAGTRATGTNSVALGTGSRATDANTVSVGSPTVQRRIVNVAAGTAATDAVNLSQLATVNTALITETNARIAGDTALSNQIAAISTGFSGLQGDVAALFDLSDRNRRNIGEANEGVAMALALDSPNVPPGARFALSGGIGHFKGRTSLAMAVSAAVGEMSSVSAGVGYGARSKEVGLRAGFQVAW